jgi:uncharacterized protein
MRRAAFVVLVLTLVGANAGCGDRVPNPVPVDVTADHHVHLLSPQLVQDWKSLGVPFSRPDSAYVSSRAALSDRGTQAFLVSMAHVYGSEEFRQALGLDLEQERLRVREENEHMAREASRDPGSLIGFCSVPLLRPYAREELEHCTRTLALPGIKVHLPAMGVRLGDEAHLVLLAGIAQRAAEEGRALLIHMAPVDGELAAADLRVFLERIVAPHPDLELYLAHLGGNGGYRASARRAVGELTRYLRGAEDASHRRVYLEMSGALLARRTDGVPASRRSEARRLAADLRALGIERVLFGSDYPVFDAGEYAALLRDRLPLSPDELAQIMTNRSPRFRPEPRPTPTIPQEGPG